MHDDIANDYQKTKVGGATWSHSDHLNQQQQQQREITYDVGQQLNLLYDDIEAGVFGPAAKSGGFAAYVRGIKEQFPKS